MKVLNAMTKNSCEKLGRKETRSWVGRIPTRMKCTEILDWGGEAEGGWKGQQGGSEKGEMSVTRPEWGIVP